ncbi:oxidoreductase [Stenotrophomonas sp. 24(2023)]|uniref:oxidoreductase n=1 Tax=Stenotrophomonas sp. 24(2023) TaxID=3068324 RepID=UPI0027DF68C4|nr:oxidoreductase [Stenotrophomonas sp. 24(2023)]WMJ69319.1 oxidoreductase [Stenotrophomonas sp. 24(2023)]
MESPDALRVVVAGASGLVGQGVLRACRQATPAGRLVSLVRRRGATGLPGVEEIVLPDFSQAGHHIDDLRGFDACLYCAGAPPIGTPERAYRHVTVELTLVVAQAFAAANPHGRFLYVSGAQANPRSPVMPLRIKGEIEQALAALPIRTVVLRPGGVRPVAGTGTAHALLKPFYAVSRPLMAVAETLFPALVVSNEAIGRAMLALARSANAPARVECADIHHWAR